MKMRWNCLALIGYEVPHHRDSYVCLPVMHTSSAVAPSAYR